MAFVIKVTVLHCLRSLNALHILCMKGQRRRSCYWTFKGVYTLIDPEITDDVIKETPPLAPPAAITSPIIVPEP